jgi:hypothetical protein
MAEQTLKPKAILFCLLATSCFAQKVNFQGLHVEKKPGASTGPAVIEVDGKTKKLAQHALQAWPVMNAQNALVLVESRDKKAPVESHLRFYEGTTRKYRDLGPVGLSSAEISEHKLSNGAWAFVLSGAIGGQPTIVVSGIHAVHGFIPASRDAQIQSDDLKYSTTSGAQKSVPLDLLLAEKTDTIYQPSDSPVKYVQFESDGTAVLGGTDNNYHAGKWRTDGESMTVFDENKQPLVWPRNSLKPVSGIPAETRLNVRLLEPLGSAKAKTGDPVHAVLISPGTIHNDILLPQGSQFNGKLVQAHGVNWGVRHETAALTVDFDSIKLPDGTTLEAHTRLDAVENSRETVKNGTVQGVRATGTIGYSAESKIQSVAALDPVSYLFTATAATATLGFAEPEILYPAGTELLVSFTTPLITSKTYPRNVPEFPNDSADQQKLAQLVRNLPFRTATKGSNKPSDLTNLVFIGSPDGLRRAFKAAGWITVDTLTAASTFMTMKTVGGNEIYNQAPMSTLLLDERPPIVTLTKTTDTFSSRHHLRIFDPLVKYNDQIVLTSSSTQDIGIAFSRKQKTFIHVIDGYIDNERSKVVNDLEFTGCVEAMDLVPRPWVPQDAYNSTGDKLNTDGAIAVMRISSCTDPRTTPTTPAEKSNRFKRVTRDTVLSVKNDVYRGNLIYQGVSGGLWAHNYLTTHDQLKPESGAWRTTDASGSEFKGLGNVSPERQQPQGADAAESAAAKALEEQHKWDPPHYEIAIEGGYLNFPNKRQELTTVEAISQDALTNPNQQYPIYVTGLGNQFLSGWSVGVSLTLNTWKWFSNEFRYSYERGRYQYANIFTKPDTYLEEGTSGLATRQFEYNLVWNLRPKTSRWRPYIAGGPALLMTSLTDVTLKKPSGPFKLGLKNVGLIIAAFQAGNTPPLDGGGVFAIGLNYGAGIKYRLTPRFTIRADWKQTWSRNPQFVSESYTSQYFVDEGYNATITHTGTGNAFLQQRIALGFAFTF